MKKRVVGIALIVALLFTGVAYGHSGNTDSNGGHRDNKNVSGLGHYHYHCGGHPPHLHPNGVCPYSSSGSSYSAPSKSVSSSVASASTVSKIQLKKPKIYTGGHKNYIEVYWEDVNHATKYAVYRSTSKDGTYKRIATVTDTFYNDGTVTNEKVYYYKVKALGSGKYSTSYYSNISSNYCFKGTITLEEEYVELKDGEKYTMHITTKNSSRKLKAASASDNISVSLSGPDKNGVYTATITATNKTKNDIGSHVDFYFSGRKSNTVRSLDVDITPAKETPEAKAIVAGCEYLLMTPGEVTWFSLFAENIEDIGGIIDIDLISGVITETEVEGAIADIIVAVNEDVSPGPEGILTWIRFFDTADEDEILLSFPVFIVNEK